MNRKKIVKIAEVLRERLSELQDIEKEYGIKISLGNCTYSDSNATFKLEVSDIGDNGEVMTKEAEDFKRRASLYGLSPKDLGRVIKDPLSGEEYTIIGLKTRSTKYPILAKGKNGKTYKFPVDVIKRMLEIDS